MPDLKKMLTLEALSEALPSWLKRSTKPEYNADEIDSTLTTNQFVTASDKDNWNAKGTYSKPSGGIPKSDLSSIVQTSLEKADSALQSETDPTVPSWAKQTNKPSYTQDEVPDGSTYKRVTQTEKDAWSGKQNALTTTQMQAVNSGITSEKVTQISTNQTNILLLEQMNGAKNYIDSKIESQTITTGGANITVTVNPDKSFEISGTTGSSDIFITICEETDFVLPAGDYVFSGLLSGAGSGLYLYMAQRSSYVHVTNGSYPTAEFSINSNQAYTVAIHLEPNKSFAEPQKIYPMISDKSAWDSGLTQYMRYALPNYELTKLEADDRKSILYSLRTGVVNLLDLSSANMTVDSRLTVTKDGNDYVVSGDLSSESTIAYVSFTFDPITSPTGSKIVLSGCPSGGSTSSGYCIRGYSSGTWVISDVGSEAKESTSSAITEIKFAFTAGQTYTNIRFSPMLCSEEVWDQLHDYEAFALPNYDLTQKANALHERTDQIQPVVSFDTGEPGWYRVFTLGSIPASAVAVGAYDNSCDIVIKRMFANTNNEHHEIKLASIYENMKFTDEFSKSSVLLITNIRYVATNDNAYIDIYYSGSDTNSMTCSINNNVGKATWKAVNTVVKVPETATGETVCSSYSFIANYLSPNDPVFIDTGSLNDLTENKLYYAGTNVTDKPTSDRGFVRNTVFNSNTGMQEFVSLGTSSDAYIRTKVSGTWQAWKQVTNA